MKARVRRTSWHTVQEQHRALATIGRLAAEHAKPDHPSDPPASKSAVRVVRNSDTGLAPPAPPRLRSRPRRGKAVTNDRSDSGTTDPDSPDAVPARETAASRPAKQQVLPGPSVKVVREQQPRNSPETGPAPHPVPRPILPTIPAKKFSPSSSGVLRFDAIDPIRPGVPDPVHGGDKPEGRASPVRSKATPPRANSAPRIIDPRGVETALNRLVNRLRTSLSGLFASSLSHGRSAASRIWRGRSRLGTQTAAAVEQIRRRPRLATGAAAAVLLVSALAGLLASAGGGVANPHGPAASNATAGHGTPASPPAAIGASEQQVGQSPAAPAALFEMTSSTSAVYQITGPIQVSLDASGSCWIQARRAGPNGDLLFQGTLVPGQSWTVAGPTWLRLGNPTAISLTVNGETVSPPATRGTPFDLQIG